MLTYNHLDPEKKVFVFELDDVIFPKQDYLLQVYYLFANSLEYVEQSPSSNELTDFLKANYLKSGEKDLFKKASEAFGIDPKHEESFNSLHVNAKLPLKLLLYKEVLGLLTYIVGEGKSIYILTKGNPMMQFNKIKQIEWNGLDQYIKAYYYDEIVLKSELKPLQYVLSENDVSPQDVLFLSLLSDKERIAESKGVDHIDISLFLRKDHEKEAL
ncbi:MAG TPA: hypothetical protein VKZ95_04825 [Sphingobacteriaceae bacterium]|nr:hypothetical protein [Sphingobacteriaceae bacterium]